MRYIGIDGKCINYKLCILQTTVKMALSRAMPFLSLHFTAWCTELMALLIPKVAQQVWFTMAAAGEQEFLVSTSENKNNCSERDTEKGWFGLSQLRTIKSKCISCFDPHCNLHLCFANIFTANKAYWIILTVCGSGEQRVRERKWLVWLESGAREWKAEKEEVKTEWRAKTLRKTRGGE